MKAFKLLTAGLLCLIFQNRADANVCMADVESEHREHVENMKSYEEEFKKFLEASPDEEVKKLAKRDYIGLSGKNSDPDYNAKVFRCNRKRDTKTLFIKKREKDFGELKKEFPRNLRERKIRGHIAYMGAFVGKYGYLLSRKGGVWTLKLGITFHPPIGKTIDMPDELATELGIWENNSYCPPAERGDIKVAVGDKEWEKILKKGKAKGRYDQDFCRIDKDKQINGKSAIEHVKDYWRTVIEKFYSRPDFVVKVFDAKGDKEFRGIRWQVWWKDQYKLRPTYHLKLWSGADKKTIAHEAGHALGLDDEYSESSLPDTKNENYNADCKKIGGGYYKDDSSENWGYLMCAKDQARFPHGLYYWIMTRRYQLGRKALPADKEKQEFGVFPVKLCAPGYKPPEEINEEQVKALCADAYSQVCKENIPEQADKVCSVIRAYPNGEDLVKKCRYCNRPEIPFEADSGDSTDDDDDDTTTEGTESASGSSSGTTPNTGTAPGAPKTPETDYPEEFEYPE